MPEAGALKNLAALFHEETAAVGGGTGHYEA
jgi:hypothetical protein